MNKISSIVLGIMLLTPAISFASTCDVTNSCGNGNPEMITNVWGGTNSDVPHIKPGQSVTDQWGVVSLCPAWFTNYCVDISHTAYYIARHK